MKFLWQRVLTHWLGDDARDPFRDQLAFVDWLNAAMAHNVVRRSEDRRHFLLQYPRGRGAGLASRLLGVPDDMA